MKVALYARVSKDICRTCNKLEAAHDATTGHEFRGQDPEAQLQPLREMCRAKGWEIAHEFIDHGFSGGKTSRPAFDELMAATEKKDRGFAAVVVWKFDRFFRSTPHMLAVLDKFKGLGLEFISLTEQIDTSTPLGRLIFTFLAAFAEFEKNLIGERISNGMKKAGAKRPGPKISERGPSRSTLYRRGRAAKVESQP